MGHSSAMDTDYTPTSELAERLLTDSFKPCRPGSLEAAKWADHYECPIAEVNACLDEFLNAGLIKKIDHWGKAGPRPQKFETTEVGWHAKERFLRARGLRHPTLLNQSAHDPKDLIVAILADRHIANARITRGFGFSTAEDWSVVAFYLDEFSAEELSIARIALIGERLVEDGSATQPNQFDLTKRGLKTYRSTVAHRVHVAPDESILDLVLEKSIRIFFSWQSEFAGSRNLLAELLARVVKAINAKAPVRPIEIIQATSLGEGAIRIDVQLMELIKMADLFVADVTPVTVDNNRRRLNDNVLIEVGYALASKAPSEVLLLAMKREELAPGNFAFDISNVQRIEVTKDEKRSGRVQAEIEEMLRRKGWLPR